MTRHPASGAPKPAVRRHGVAAVVLAESIVVIVYGFVLAIDTLVADPASLAGSASLALLVVLLGVGVGVVGVGVWRGQRWSRAPGVVWQFLQLAATLPALGSARDVGAPYLVVAAALVVASATVLIGLFLPGVIDDPDEATG